MIASLPLEKKIGQLLCIGIDGPEVDDPTRFILVEIYRTADDPARHKETAHYAAWRDAVESMMAEPRRSVKLKAVFPVPADWEMPTVVE